MKTSMQARRVALSGLLVALMLVMGYIESLIPMGTAVPGIKPGLSNGVLIFAVYMFDVPLCYCLMILKVLLSGLMFGGISAMLYSFAGGLVSLTAMLLLRRVPRICPEFVGMAGGVLHNVGQVAMAMVVLETDKLADYLFVLIPVGIACGLLTGFLSDLVMRRLTVLGKLPKLRQERSGIVIAVIAMILLAVTLWVIYSGNPLLRPGAKEETEVEWDAAEADIPEMKGLIS